MGEIRLKHIMDQKAIKGARYDKGLNSGIIQEKRKIANKMKLKNIDINIISEITGLTTKEIQNL